MLDGVSRPLRHILFVEDDADVQKAARLLLGRHDMRVSEARNPAEAWSVLATEPVDAILLDLNFTRGATSGAEGFACLTDIMAHDPRAVIVVVTGHSGVAIAVEAMRAGASDFVMKPWRNDRLIETLERALATPARRAAQTPAVYISDADTPLLGDSPAMRRVREVLRHAAPTEASVLIHGAAGVGKSLMARTLHRQSSHPAGPFIVVDLAALSVDAATTALFGELQSGGGALIEASGGTLVLDEVSALTSALQIRVLRALEATTKVRVVATTRRPRHVLQSALSGDLLYRLNTVTIEAPSLREREADGALLAEHFLRLFALRHGLRAKPLTVAAVSAVAAHPWPGDVAALRQAMERCVIFTQGEQHDVGDIPFPDEGAVAPAAVLNLVQSERAMVAAALKSNSFNVSHAAKQLGLTRAALYRRMAKYGL